MCGRQRGPTAFRMSFIPARKRPIASVGRKDPLTKRPRTSDAKDGARDIFGDPPIPLGPKTQGGKVMRAMLGEKKPGLSQIMANTMNHRQRSRAEAVERGLRCGSRKTKKQPDIHSNVKRRDSPTRRTDSLDLRPAHRPPRRFTPCKVESPRVIVVGPSGNVCDSDPEPYPNRATNPICGTQKPVKLDDRAQIELESKASSKVGRMKARSGALCFSRVTAAAREPVRYQPLRSSAMGKPLRENQNELPQKPKTRDSLASLFRREGISTNSFYSAKLAQPSSFPPTSKLGSQVSVSKRVRTTAPIPPSTTKDMFSPRQKIPRDERVSALSEEEREKFQTATKGISKQKIVAKIEGANIVLRGHDIVRLRGRRWLNDEVINGFTALINKRSKNHFEGTSKGSTNANTGRAQSCSDNDDENDCTFVDPNAVHPGRPRAYMFNSFFYARLCTGGYEYELVRRWPLRAGVDISSLDLVLFPINLGNSHWVLAAIDLRRRQFVYLDSMYGADNSGVLKHLRQWLYDEVENKHGRERAEKMKIDTWDDIERPSYLPRQGDDGSCGVFTLYVADYLELGKTPDFVQEDISILRQRAVLYLMRGSLPAA